MDSICISSKRDKLFRWGVKHKGQYVQSASLNRVIVYILRDKTKFIKCIIWGHDYDNKFYCYKCRNCGKEY